MDVVILPITTPLTAGDSDSKLQHSLFNMMQKEINDLQDKLSGFEAKTKKLENNI